MVPRISNSAGPLKYLFPERRGRSQASGIYETPVELTAYNEGGTDLPSPVVVPLPSTDWASPLRKPSVHVTIPELEEIPASCAPVGSSGTGPAFFQPPSSAHGSPDLPSNYLIAIMYKLIVKLLTILSCISFNPRSMVEAVKRSSSTSGRPSKLESGLTGFNDDNVPKGKLCGSEIFCHGELLDKIQMSQIFEDSKHFVDMKLKFTPTIVLENWRKFMEEFPHANTEKLKEFVFDNFDPPGSELEDVVPDDFKENPDFLARFDNEAIREWAAELHQLWKKLGKKVIDDVRVHPKQYSILYVPHTTMVPGGRFREFYYWDSYWTIRGLLVSGMTDTVKGMIINFLTLVREFGFVPNGGRIYYSQRSQPPFLIPMMKEYVDATEDIDFLRDNINVLEEEYRFWERSRTDTIVENGEKYRLSRYNSFGNQPRPESYREDVETAHGLPVKAQEALHSHIQAACESGWDFSSRWFRKDVGDTTATLQQLETRNIYPVDLNSLLVMNSRILADFHTRLGNPQGAVEYESLGEIRNRSLTKFLYNPEKGMWFDYDRTLKKSRDGFYASNIFPLWTESFPQGAQKHEIAEKALNYLREEGVLGFPGGFPTSLEESGEQWDFPNGWAPLQHMVVEGLEKTGHPEAQSVAREIAEKWMRNNYLTWKKHEAMYEKYSTAQVGYPGGGGEYRVVDGFGWTNGVALDLLTRYPYFDTTSTASVPATPAIVSQLALLVMAACTPSYLLSTGGGHAIPTHV